ncbi:MAG TPA: hypothetical protein PLP29_15130 [Candidatus Ozemobacteraceae bacterium]|nr:hypothetical protein [Candidatus Ozemobacteraceae bacterium]
MNKPSELWKWSVLTVLLVVGLAWVDVQTGYELNFFVFYFIPVTVGAWFIGREAAIVLAILCAVVWGVGDIQSGHVYSSPVYGVWNTMIRFASFLAIGWTVAGMRKLLDRERETAEALRQALSEVKVLETFLPICAQCKKIRTESGEWQQLEIYIGNHTNTTFSHGFCPECARKTLAEARSLMGK